MLTVRHGVCSFMCMLVANHAEVWKLLSVPQRAPKSVDVLA